MKKLIKFFLKKQINILILIMLTMVFSFQNCSQKKKEEDKIIENTENTQNEENPIEGPIVDDPPVLDCLLNPSLDICKPVVCKFNGVDLQDGEKVSAFQNSSVDFGSSCVFEERVCANGILSGSYVYSSCNVGLPASCLFDSKTVEHGQEVVAFQNSTATFGSSCVSEPRICQNGVLQGSYNYATCVVDSPKSCIFNGQTLQHGDVVTAFGFSTVPYGSTCASENRVCNNGVLTGRNEFATCNVEAAQSCLFNGNSVAHGQNVNAFQASTVDYGNQCIQEIRTCDNGILNGSFNFASCNVQEPASCLFNGLSISHGQFIDAFKSSSVPYQSICEKEVRACDNGELSGSYEYNSCLVSAPASCTLNGSTVASGSTITAYQSSSVSYGENCISETRSCDNGVLSGSYNHLSCTGSPPPANSCILGDQVILDGASVTAYLTTSVSYGSTCTSESRTCSNGVLSGAYQYLQCVPQSPENCSFNGQTVVHGNSIIAYRTATPKKNGACDSQTRTCTNGSLSGSFSYLSCQ